MIKDIHGYRALAEAVERKVSTVHEWVENGCPVDKSERIHKFNLEEVKEWMSARDRMESDDEEGTELQREKIRKLKLEGDKLQHEKDLRSGLFVPVSEIQPAWESRLKEIRDLVEVLIDEIKELSPDLTAEESETIDKKMVDGFNQIANTN